MVKLRKKPIIINGDPYTPGMEDGFNESGRPIIHTLEGDHTISDGDWILIGVLGERYPCKPDIVALTYDIVEG